MSAHEIFLLVIIGLSILLDFRVKSRRKKRSAASSEKRARPSVPEFPPVSNLPLPAGEALPQTYSPVVSGSFEVPDMPESAEDETPAEAIGGEKSPAIPERDRREVIDPKKLVIYSEIMSPKFKE